MRTILMVAGAVWHHKRRRRIVSVALSQVGNVGGQPLLVMVRFWKPVEWCACFVSWCANESGYIDTGVTPKFAGCVLGSQWFMDRGQWQDGSFEPSAGHSIIFFDWEGDGGPTMWALWNGWKMGRSIP